MSYTEGVTKRDILKIYKALQHDSNEDDRHVKEKWELKTITVIIVNEYWEDTF